MNIIKATKSYENWLENQLDKSGLLLDREAIDVKHKEMASGAFPFLRSTFYRWVQRWQFNGESDWQTAPQILSVGDLHFENFGTWRDLEGRLVWGINDFDEACWLPYTNDLVRLATSAYLAIDADDKLDINFREACRELTTAYEVTLTNGREAASPFILSELNQWLGEIASEQLENPQKFWKKLDKHPSASSREGATELTSDVVPNDALEAIGQQLPDGFQIDQWKRRQAGLGSLGRPRFVALGLWQGGRLAREGKAFVPSAIFWAEHKKETENFVTKIIEGAVRCPDPKFAVNGYWLVRRLSPDCTKLELTDIPKKREAEFFFSMGRETANVHLGSSAMIPLVLEHLRSLSENWLEKAALECAEQVKDDWKVWREYYAESKD